LSSATSRRTKPLAKPLGVALDEAAGEAAPSSGALQRRELRAEVLQLLPRRLLLQRVAGGGDLVCIHQVHYLSFATPYRQYEI
jgi:hypothetical protein